MQEITSLITIKQLPVIVDELHAVKATIQERVDNALSLVCTEDTYKEIKKVRSDLNKEFQALEQRRKEIKEQVLAPYKDFEGVYDECAGSLYKSADVKLGEKIREVEAGLKAQKEADLESYFAEYRESLGIAADFVALPAARIKVGLSDSKVSLHRQAAEFLDRIHKDLQVIDSYADREEIMVEYAKTYDLSNSLLIVDSRHKEMERERQRKEEQKARQEAAAAAAASVQQVVAEETMLQTPVARPAPVEEPIFDPFPKPAVYKATFTVTATLEQLKALKSYLIDGGYEYEC